MMVLDLQNLTSPEEFYKDPDSKSCKWGQTLSYLDARGKWKQINLSANVFEVLPITVHQWYHRVKVQAFHFLCYFRFLCLH